MERKLDEVYVVSIGILSPQCDITHDWTLKSMRNLVVEGAGGVVTVIAGGGAAKIAAKTAWATAAAISIDEGGARPGAGAAVAGPVVAGVGAGAPAKPVEESVISVPHCR